jgi:hypothetical protein
MQVAERPLKACAERSRPSRETTWSEQGLAAERIPVVATTGKPAVVLLL